MQMQMKHAASVTSLDDLVELLTSYKQDTNGDDQGLTDQLQNVTSTLIQYLQTSRALDSLQEQRQSKVAGKFSRALKDVEIIINDNSVHPGIRAALLRKKLRAVGIFSWNADLEGMVFGYGYETHDKLVVSSMPRSIKDFCMSETEILSGIAYDRFIYQMTGSKGERDPNRNDAERICFLVETCTDGRLTSREVFFIACFKKLLNCLQIRM